MAGTAWRLLQLMAVAVGACGSGLFTSEQIGKQKKEMPVLNRFSPFPLWIQSGSPVPGVTAPTFRMGVFVVFLSVGKHQDQGNIQKKEFTGG